MQNNPYFPQQKKNQQAQVWNAADTGSVVSSTSSTESSIVSDVLANVQNESLMDCELVSSLDHQAHLASRFVLGARSSVLRKQLFSNKKKTTKQSSASPLPTSDDPSTMIQLQVPYSSNVIQALLDYCHTDAIVRPSRTLSATAVREWVDLMDCAQTYQLPGLQALVERLAESVFLAASPPPHHLPLACALLDECLQHEDDNSSSSVSLQQIAWQAIRQDPAATLLHPPGGGVTHCSSPTTLTRILQDDQLQCSELVLFRAIQIWLQHQPSQTNDADTAALLLSWMDWTRMAPSELVGPVRASGLVDEPVIQQALAEIAQRVERETATSNHYHYDRLFDRPRTSTSSSAVSYCGGASVPSSQPLFPQDPMDAVAKRGHSHTHKVQASSSSSSSSSSNNKSSTPASPRLLQQERPRTAATTTSRVGRWSPTSVLNSHSSSSAPAATKEQHQQQQQQETPLDTNSLTGKHEEDIPRMQDSSAKSVLRRHFDSVAEKLDFVCQHGCMATTTATPSSSASVSQ